MADQPSMQIPDDTPPGTVVATGYISLKPNFDEAAIESYMKAHRLDTGNEASVHVGARLETLNALREQREAVEEAVYAVDEAATRQNVQDLRAASLALLAAIQKDHDAAGRDLYSFFGAR